MTQSDSIHYTSRQNRDRNDKRPIDVDFVRDRPGLWVVPKVKKGGTEDGRDKGRREEDEGDDTQRGHGSAIGLGGDRDLYRVPGIFLCHEVERLLDLILDAVLVGDAPAPDTKHDLRLEHKLLMNQPRRDIGRGFQDKTIQKHLMELCYTFQCSDVDLEYFRDRCGVLGNLMQPRVIGLRSLFSGSLSFEFFRHDQIPDGKGGIVLTPNHFFENTVVWPERIIQHEALPPQCFQNPV